MSTEEVKNILKDARKNGIRTLKITGGEPTLREDLLKIIEFAHEQHFEDIGLTTNGTMLDDVAGELKKAGLSRVNIGCDTISRGLPKNTTSVRSAIISAKSAELDVKVNMVVMTINSHEINDMIHFAMEMKVNLQLIELVETNKEIFDRYFTSLDKTESNLHGRSEYRPMQNRKRVNLGDIFVEFVRPRKSFCEKCNKIRVTSDGRYKACLMRDESFTTITEAIRGRSYGYG